MGSERVVDVESGARPFPVGTLLAKASFHGVGVDVVDTRLGRSARSGRSRPPLAKTESTACRAGVTGDPPGSFGGLVNLGKKKAAYLP